MTALTPEQALDELEARYARATDALGRAVRHYVETGEPPTSEAWVGFAYPELRVTHRPAGPEPTTRRSYAQFPAPGVYASAITHPDFFRPYLLQQLSLLVADHAVTIEVGDSDVPIPYPFVIDGTAGLDLDRVDPAMLARQFPIPRLKDLNDEVVDGVVTRRPDGMRPLALFEAPRIDTSLRRLQHYTGTDWRATQPWILFTNYHRYVDAFVDWAAAELVRDPGARLVAPGGVDLDVTSPDPQAQVANAPWRRFQMPAYHFIPSRGEGITLVNIGVGPSNAKTITDHLAVLRPHCWLMIGHCGGLRVTQRIGDYALAHGYLRADHVMDDIVPLEVPIPALAEVQLALQEATARVSGDEGDELWRRLRTGTVVSTDDRNWEFRFPAERRRISQSRAIAIDMESAVIATQGFRMRVPYGTLLCVSDKPLHGEIKLPGAASAFYNKAVSEHLKIGIETLGILRQDVDSLHSRKLRSFDEPPLR
jgi:AMP nucleosidase